jgi:hypothetical protein
MTKSKKILLGIFTFLPFLCILAYFVFFLKFFFSSISLHTSDAFINDHHFFDNFFLLAILIITSVISGFVLMIYYVIHANKNPKFDSNQKLMWILILVLTSFMGNIIYYFVEIIPDKQIEK